MLHRAIRKHHLPLIHPFRLVACQSTTISIQNLVDWNLGHMDVLHDSPNDRETTGFCCERIDLVRSLPNIAKETFNGIGGANVAMHHWWKRIKGQHMLFIFHQAADGFGIALLVFGGCQAAKFSNASSFFSCFQIPASWLLTSFRSR